MVLVSSTGVIGQALPVEKIESAMPQLFDAHYLQTGFSILENRL
jgi:N-acetylglutamate synthase/N-acetylornithine aminotransferase